MRNCLLLLAIAFAFPAKAQIEPSKVDPSLAIVSQGFGFRVLVYSVCSPEHCWNETYLQSISFGAEETKVMCTSKLNEIAYGHSISKVNWSGDAKAPIASLAAQASHGGFEPRTIALKPKTDCSYTIEGASGTSF
ncbi:hypothetical protein [Aliikangiella sp. IMCC44632]